MVKIFHLEIYLVGKLAEGQKTYEFFSSSMLTVNNLIFAQNNEDSDCKMLGEEEFVSDDFKKFVTVFESADQAGEVSGSDEVEGAQGKDHEPLVLQFNVWYVKPGSSGVILGYLRIS